MDIEQKIEKENDELDAVISSEVFVNKDTILRFFKFIHLPKGRLRNTSALFAELAVSVHEIIPSGEEKDFCLRKLLEAKDCAVRGVL